MNLKYCILSIWYIVSFSCSNWCSKYVHTMKLIVCFLFSSKKFHSPAAVCESSRINQENQNRSPPSPHPHFSWKSNFFLSAHPPENNSICSSKTYKNYHQIQWCIWWHFFWFLTLSLCLCEYEMWKNLKGKSWILFVMIDLSPVHDPPLPKFSRPQDCQKGVTAPPSPPDIKDIEQTC